ncbi:uncharacterized protein [Notamacropus eugenii]|uniref:uncharacterized protein isoform X2 n=1 Tax=Notamacropus eugenii TaxID=9315 RepID=UPI003B67B2D2
MSLPGLGWGRGKRREPGGEGGLANEQANWQAKTKFANKAARRRGESRASFGGGATNSQARQTFLARRLLILPSLAPGGARAQVQAGVLAGPGRWRRESRPGLRVTPLSLVARLCAACAPPSPPLSSGLRLRLLPLRQLLLLLLWPGLGAAVKGVASRNKETLKQGKGGKKGQVVAEPAPGRPPRPAPAAALHEKAGAATGIRALSRPGLPRAAGLLASPSLSAPRRRDAEPPAGRRPAGRGALSGPESRPALSMAWPLRASPACASVHLSRVLWPSLLLSLCLYLGPWLLSLNAHPPSLSLSLPPHFPGPPGMTTAAPKGSESNALY